MQSTKNYDYQRQTTAKAKKKTKKNETKLKAEEKKYSTLERMAWWRGMLHLDLSVIFIITNFSRQYIKHTRTCIQTYIYIWKKYVCK